MGDPHIFRQQELTDRVPPAPMLSTQNAGSPESGTGQNQPHHGHALMFEFRPLENLDSRSPGMAIFNMI